MEYGPAFQFYPGDWLGSERVALMTLEEEGAYIRLLAFCWRAGSIPSNIDRLKLLIGKGASTTLATTLSTMFQPDPNDGSRLVHDRLEKERQKQKEWREKSREGGKKSAAKRKNNKARVVQPPHQPKGNSSSSFASSSSSSSLNSKDPLNPSCPKPEPILDDEALRLSKLLAEGILKNNPNNVTLNNGKRDHTVKTWAKDIDKLHRIDGQKYPDIEKVIRWTQRDEFWSKNILSAGKLRKQWDQLWIKANGKPHKEESNAARTARRVRELERQGL